MGELLANLIPLAIGLAISPIPIIAVILMLSSKKAVVNAIVFDAAWLFAIIGTSAVVLLCFGSESISGSRGAGTASDIVHLAFGVLLLALAAKRFMQKRKGVPDKQPKLLASIETIKPLEAMLFGFAMVVLNPKNLVILLSALAQVVQQGASTGTNIAVIAIFTLIASAGVLLPLAVYVLFRKKSATILSSWKTWLTEHNNTVMMYLLLVLGVVLLIKGIMGLVA